MAGRRADILASQYYDARLFSDAVNFIPSGTEPGSEVLASIFKRIYSLAINACI
jgi:hypothetical protein